jgi:hypothetical protein
LFRKEPTALRYYGDGTGRDSYVVQDFGGLVYNYGAENISVGHFYKSLRQNSVNRSVDLCKPGSMFHSTKNWLSPKAKKMIKECFYLQVAMTNRLSTPKSQMRRRAYELATQSLNNPSID